MGKKGIADQLHLLKSECKTSFLVTSHLIGIDKKESNEGEKQEIGCVI
ncbi:MAG: hypothetical protein IC227_06035 [Enterococcus lacertideformus]|uniref:Uncharacterized protein n=1 Tax=Enterococcus lacertideformus TaxID=2771493 RepID=A0A931F9S8_9ENTE|nr:hypothetical protein [Enterococcus lacertideformus]